ncbi:MAG: cyclic nucleotide-binding/CBS domain-containing protein [Halodesulfurarchaeum sp.]
MDDMFVGRIMSEPVSTVRPETTVREAARQMREADIGSVVVVDDLDHIEGILTSTDFVAAVANERPLDETPVEAFMTEDVITTHANQPVRDVADRMSEHGFHHLPVVEDEHVIGIVTTSDLTTHLAHREEPTLE